MSDGQLHAIVGDDDFLVRQKAKEIFDSLIEHYPDDLSRETVDGRADRVDDVERILKETRSAVETLSLFGGGKLVWLNEMNFLNQSRVGASQGAKDALETIKETFERLGEDNQVILSACPVHRNHSFVKWLQKSSRYEDVSKGEKGDAAFRRTVADAAKEFGVSYAPGAVDMLAAKIGANTRLAAEETQKLATYLGTEETEITEQLVADMVPEFGEADFFEAAEAFAAGDLAWTLDAIDRHFFHAKDSRPLLSSLQGRNRLVIQLRVLIDSGEIDPRSRLNKDVLDRIARKRSVHFADASEKNALNVFTQNPWYLGRLVPAAAKYNARRLIDFQEQFIRAFEQLLGATKEDQPTIMKELAIRCLGRAN